MSCVIVFHLYVGFSFGEWFNKAAIIDIVNLYIIPGLWLSSRFTDEISVQNAAQVLGGLIAFVSGKFVQIIL